MLMSARIGMLKGVIKLVKAVKVIDKDTSPLYRQVNIFDVAPPGAKAMIIRPTAISGGSVKTRDMLNAISRSKSNCAQRPIATTLGELIIFLKSTGLKERPIPNMIMNRDAGRMTLVSKSGCMLIFL